MSDSLICASCGKTHAPHGSVSRAHWEDAHRGWLRGMSSEPGAAAFGPLPQGRAFRFNVGEKSQESLSGFSSRKDLLELSWAEYGQWTDAQAEAVRHKDTNAIFVHNPSLGRFRKEHNFDGMSRMYYDCDEAGDWTKLAAWFDMYDLVPKLYESSSSVVKNSPAAALPFLPNRFHIDIPLTQVIRLSKNSASSSRDGFGPEWDHEKNEHKRAYQYIAGYLSAKAGFGGVGIHGDHHCGFDLSTNQLCNPRFVATRAVPGGRLPHKLHLSGTKALDYYAFLREIGFEWRPYVAPQAQPVKTVIYRTPSGETREQKIVTQGDSVYAAVKAAISVSWFLETYLGLQPTQRGGNQGHFYFCPVHHEETNPSQLTAGPNKAGFNVFVGKFGIEHWRCHGDCSTGGDVIHLAAAVWACGRHQAAMKLATVFGLDMTPFLAKALPASVVPAPAAKPERDLTPAEMIALVEDTDEQGTYYDPIEPVVDPIRFVANPVGEPKRKKRTRRRKLVNEETLPRVCDWIEDYVCERADRTRIARTVCSFLMSMGQGMREKGKEFTPRQEPKRLAASVESILHADYTAAQASGEVFSVLGRLQDGEAEAGRKALINAVGPVAMHALAGAVWRDERSEGRAEDRGYNVYLRETLGFDRVEGQARVFLNEIAKRLRASAPTLPENPTKEQVQVWEVLTKRNLAFLAAVQRPIGCGQFCINRRTTRGRDLGWSFVPCESKACTFCVMVESLQEWDLALVMWKKLAGKGVYVAEIQLETLDQVEDLKQYMKRSGRPRLTVTGFRDRKPIVLCLMLEASDQTWVVSSMDAWAGREHHQKQSTKLVARGGTTYQLATPEEALGVVMELKVSYHAELAQRMHEEDAPGVEEFVGWSYRRQVIVSRSKKGLPWPTQEQVKAAKKEGREEHELEEGEDMRYHLYHRRTKTLLLTTDRPPTMDQCMAAARAHPELKALNAYVIAEEMAGRRSKRLVADLTKVPDLIRQAA